MRTFISVLACVLVLGSTTSPWQTPVQAQSVRPTLVVMLVVDQMRADYIDRFQHQWSRGLARLLKEGATFPNAAYPFANTVTCAGHASVATGALPAAHGMILNAWWDRDFGRNVACADDPTSVALSYGKPVSPGGESAARLLLPTLADALKGSPTAAARTAAFSLKARSAVTLAGARPDAVAWVSDQGAWVTSTAYGGLSPAVARFVDAHPVEHALWTSWERAKPVSDYWFAPIAVGVRSADAVALPRPIRGWDEWQESPLSDAYLADMALNVSADLGLGARPGRTDFLGISFSALDLVGHSLGPQSHEVQDVLMRLDDTIGRLLDGLDRRVGRGNYVVALTADHGVALIPEAADRDGFDAGRIQPREVISAVQTAVSNTLGRGRWDVRVQNGNVYLDVEVMHRLENTPDGVRAVVESLSRVRGIGQVYSRRDLVQEPAPHGAGHGAAHDLAVSSDPTRRAVAASYHPDRSGDFVFVNRANWLFGPNVANHGTPYGYDSHVPVVLYGFGISRGSYARAVSPLDIAPTLARLAGVSLPMASGQVLHEAVSARPATDRRPSR